MANSEKRTYKNFSIGLMADSAEKDPDNIPENAIEGLVGLEQADNAEINGMGGISKRKGSDKLNTVSYAATCKQIEEWLKSDASVQLFAVIGTNLASIAEPGGVATTVQALNAAAGKVFWFPTITGGADNLYFGDGSKYFVWDGTNPCAEVTPAAGADLTNVKKCHMAVYSPKSHRYFFASLDYSWVLYSEPDEPDNVKVLSILYPGQVEGNVVGLDIFGDAVVVRFAHGGYVWRGIDPSVDVVWWPIPLKTGGFNPWDSAVVDGGLVFPGLGGVYQLGMSLLGANVTLEESGDVVPNIAENRVTSVIDSILNKDIVCTVDDTVNGRIYMAYTDDTDSYAKNVKVLVNHRRNGGGFTIYTGWQVNHWCLRKNGDLLFATDNYIMKVNQDAYNDNGAAIHFKVKTKWLNLGFLGFMKKLFTTTITSQQNDNTSTIDVTVSSDNGVDTVTKTGISLNSGFIWGMIYGPVWVGTSIITKWFDSILEAMRYQVTLENNVVDESVDLYGLGFQFKVGKPNGERVA